MGGASGQGEIVPGEQPELVGRDEQLGAIRERLDDVLASRASGAAIVGDAGSGKTALLNVVVGSLSGFRVVWATGVERVGALVCGPP